MKLMISSRSILLATFIAIVFAAGCTPLIGAHSPTAYKNATSLKAETLAIMDKAKERYLDHKNKVEHVNVELNKAYEYVKGLPRNSISVRQWEILIQKDGDLIGKFFKRWEERSTLSTAYIDEFKPLVSDAFDEIICLEANKGKATSCSKPEGEK